MGECALVICKYYAILYKGLEHLWIVASGGPGINSLWIPGVIVHCQETVSRDWGVDMWAES